MEEQFGLEVGETEDEEIGRTLGAAAAAMSLPTPSRDKAVNAKTAAFLDEQTAVLRLQKEHLHEQRDLQLSHLKWRRFSDRMKAALQLMTGVIGLAVTAAIGAAVWDAAHADSVVVDAFHAPPALAGRGVDGTVVAAGLLDELQRLQAETRESRLKRGVRDAWSSDIKAEVPETGVSIGEVMRDLHRWLGRETHVGGDLVQIDQGLTLTVRGDGFAAKSFSGPAGALSQLTTQAAGYVYDQSEPYPAATYLEGEGRHADAIALVQSKYAGASAADRPWLLNAWGNALLNLGRVPEGLAKYQEEVRLKPDFWIGYNNIANAQWSLGREEDAWRSGKAMEVLAGRGRPGQKAPETYFQNLDPLTWNIGAWRAAMVQDMESHGGFGSAVTQDSPILADAAQRLHDPVAAELYLQTAINAERDPFAVAMAHFVRGRIALDRGDFAKSAAEMDAFTVAYASYEISTQLPGYGCWAAPAEEMAGHPDKADAAIKAGGHFVDCYRFRADLLEHRGDWAAAQKAYGDAVALAPDLPAAYYSWGLALARHGDPAGAEAKFAAANHRGPHWADPLKAWGDALVAQRRYSEAELRYAEAASYAPKWIALHLAYGNALRADGKYREAIAQYHAVTEVAGHG